MISHAAHVFHWLASLQKQTTYTDLHYVEKITSYLLFYYVHYNNN